MTAVNAIQRGALRALSHLLPEPVRRRLVEALCARLRRQLSPLCDTLTDDFFELLLRGMDLALLLSPRYRAAAAGFDGVVVFCTKNGKVAVTAVFAGGDLRVEREARPAWDCRITFADSDAIWSFLLAEDQDILDSILRNAVEVEGNLNYVYRFGFLAKELALRFEPPRLAA
jgi:hypothetical protein